MAGPAAAAIGTRATSAGAATLAVALPAVVTGANGALLAAVTSKNNATHSTATAGWTKLNQTNSGASFTASLWIAKQGAAAPTFTWTGSVACSGQIAYYADPASDVLASVSVLGVAGAGTVSPHTSAAITTDIANALAVYVDVAAANTALTAPSGWTTDGSTGSATDVGHTQFGSKAVPTSGTSSGAISSAGAAAAWVQWQLEIKDSTATALQSSKIEADAWLDPPAGLDAAKLESGAWLDPPSGLDVSKIEMVAWLDKGQLFSSKLEADAWLDPPDGLDSSSLESIAWLDPPPVVSTQTDCFCSIVW